MRVYCLWHLVDESRQSGLAAESENVNKCLSAFSKKACSKNALTTGSKQERTMSRESSTIAAKMFCPTISVLFSALPVPNGANLKSVWTSTIVASDP